MTEIRSIHGIPQDEVAQRSREVRRRYLPYLSLTEGEMRLANLLDQAKIQFEFYRDRRYAEMANLLQNALFAGVHGNIHFTGRIPDYLQPVAAEIRLAKKKIKPAAGDILLERPGMERPRGFMNGIHIGDEQILPQDQSLRDCHQYAVQYVRRYYQDLSIAQILLRLAIPLANQNIVQKYNEGKAECNTKKQIEQLLNDGITDFGHHMVYGFLPDGPAMPSRIQVKYILHSAGKEDLARLAGSTVGNMNGWLNTAVMRRNAESSLEPYGGFYTNAFWTNIPPDGIQAFIDVQKVRNISNAERARRITNIVRQYKQAAVNIDPATATLVVNTLKAIMLAIIAAAPAIITALNNKRADAFAGARGIGTSAFGPSENDWDGDGVPNDEDPTPNGEPGNGISTPLLIGGGLLAAYLLTQD